MLPIKHEEVFRRCIVNASDEIADYLSGILMRLQIFSSRMKEVDDYFNDQKGHVHEETIKRRTCDIVEIYTLLDSLFGFARSTEEFKDKKISQENIMNSILSLKISIGQENELAASVKMHLDRGGIMGRNEA